MFLAAGAIAVGASARQAEPLYKDKSAPVDQRVDDLLGRMTLHEKVLQLQNRASGKADQIDGIFSGQSYGTTHEMGMSAYDCAVMYAKLHEYSGHTPGWAYRCLLVRKAFKV